MRRCNQESAVNAASDHQWFVTTHWSVVLSSGQGDSTTALAALEDLCRTYWPPLYSYVRRQGFGPEDAQDLTQSFFAKLLEKNFWARADPRKGRFRSLLLTALRQFLADERDRANTAKRGRGFSWISLDDPAVEGQFLEGLAHNLSGEQQYDRQWVSTVLQQARERLRQEYIDAGKAAFYDRVNLLSGSREGVASYAEVGRQLGMTVSAVKSAVFRLRDRYGELVREEVARTVSDPAELNAEIQYFRSVISS